MKNTFTKILLAFILIFFFAEAKAQDFVYTPINPAFGGSFYNYSWLLSSAQAQNKITEDSDYSSYYDQDPLESFESSLNQMILNQLSSKLIENQFGVGDLNEGEYNIGNYRILIDNLSDGININIIDSSTGNQTSITIPYF